MLRKITEILLDLALKNSTPLFLIAIMVFTLSSCLEYSVNSNSISNPTFTEHIAPIIYKNCSPCHRPNSAGPFDLLTYEDVRKRAKMIAAVTTDRYMPPWPADPNYRTFRDQKYLSEKDIETIALWVKEGAILGDTSLLSPAPDFPNGSLIGEPDLRVYMKDTFHIAGDNRDRFMMMKLPFELERDTFIRAIEFVPDNKKLVHHVNGHVIKYREGSKKNINNGEWLIDTETIQDLNGFKLLDLHNDDGSYPTLKPLVANYLPGTSPSIYPEGIGSFAMTKKGAILANDLHYGPSAKDDSDLSYFNIFFAERAPERVVQEFQLGTLGVSEIIPPLIIPPDSIYHVSTEYFINQDISILTINPHMHLLGKEFKAYAYKENSDTIPLIHIPSWDFKWQYFYTFPKMLKVPGGYRIKVEASFDNTRENPLNPYNPPQLIMEREGSMRTTDEMLQFIINYTMYQSGDEHFSLELE